MKENVGL